MSYILDALSKSEHERRQQQESQHFNPFESQGLRPSPKRAWLPWVLVGVMLMVCVGLFAFLWWLWTGKAAPSQAAYPTVREHTPAVSSALRSESPTSGLLAPESPATKTHATEPELGTQRTTLDQPQVPTASLSSSSIPSPLTAKQIRPRSSDSEAVHRLYAKSEQRRLRKTDSGGDGTLTADVQREANQSTLDKDAPTLDTDALVAAALTELQNGVPPTESEADASMSPEAIASMPVTPVDLTQSESESPSEFPRASDLPQSVQQALPAMYYSAHIYSASSQSGFVEINGGKYRQGETVAPGLFLERLSEEGAVFSFGGHVFFQEAMTDWNRP